MTVRDKGGAEAPVGEEEAPKCIRVEDGDDLEADVRIAPEVAAEQRDRECHGWFL